jgi:predicted lactoylglutathione lyase
VDIRIGITNTPRELAFESAQTRAEVEAVIAGALESGAKLVSLTDDKGTVYMVPTDSLAYIEIGSEESRRIGFGA